MDRKEERALLSTAILYSGDEGSKNNHNGVRRMLHVDTRVGQYEIATEICGPTLQRRLCESRTCLPTVQVSPARRELPEAAPEEEEI